ncbi:MAG: lipopolysaccharide biosynthesis protein, partial [Hungatella hathewayi]|nr:lipopolysaccharide biosynthesis protein [Hungatella hathewayi]
MNKLTGALLKTGGNREKQNMLWNMAGSFCYAFASMVLAFLVMGIIGDEEGGTFSFGFSVLGQQMFILAYFGIRPFHITDGTGEYSFGEYLHHRYLTCGAALLCGIGYLMLFHSRYTGREMTVLFLLTCYKVVDGFADVYETEFQRNGRLYLTGKSNTFRVMLSVGSFLTALTVSHRYYLLNPLKTDNSLIIACVIAVAAQVLGVLLFDIPVLRELPTVAYEWGRGKIKPLFQNSSLLFVSVFLDFYIFSAVRYAIDAHMNRASSGYFNIIFMPTSVINLAAGFVIRPFLTYLTEYWTEKRYRDFNTTLKKLTLVISGLTVLAVGATWAIGGPVLGI